MCGQDLWRRSIPQLPPQRNRPLTPITQKQNGHPFRVEALCLFLHTGRQESMLLQGMPLTSSRLCFHSDLTCFRAQLCIRHPRPAFQLVHSASSEAPASRPQTGSYRKLGQVCDEMSKAPPSVVWCSRQPESPHVQHSSCSACALSAETGIQH